MRVSSQVGDVPHRESALFREVCTHLLSLLRAHACPRLTRERERDRQTDRDRQRETDRDRERDRDRDRERESTRVLA